MATKSKADKSRPADAGQDVPAAAPVETTFAADALGEVKTELEVAFPAQTAATPEPAPLADPEPPVALSVSTSLAIIEEPADATAEAFAASFEFDSGNWAKKSIELWAENAAAFLDLAEEIGKAKSFEDVIDIQSRFASDRFAAFIRQSQELMELALSTSTLSVAPLCGARKAA